MDNAQNTRPTVAGFVLPWDVVVPNDTGFLDVIDAEGAHVAIVDGNDSFVLSLITDVNTQRARIAALEAAIVEVVRIYGETTVELKGPGGCPLEVAYHTVQDIRIPLGLADRDWGNPDQAEQVTA